jgi:hypothetical protein
MLVIELSLDGIDQEPKGSAFRVVGLHANPGAAVYGTWDHIANGLGDVLPIEDPRVVGAAMPTILKHFLDEKSEIR